MFMPRDAYSYANSYALYIQDTDEDSEQVGVLDVKYQVVLYNDVGVLNYDSVSTENRRQYILTATQRIRIPSSLAGSMNPIGVSSSSQQSFQDYPALLQGQFTFADEDSSSPSTLLLIDYNPVTVNSAVSESNGTQESTGTCSGIQNSTTTGSSYQAASNYSVMLPIPLFMAGSSNANSSELSNTSATSSSASSSSGSSASVSMSVKDWGAYSYVDKTTVMPVWTFGQEYPWNAIECRFVDKDADDDGTSELAVSPVMLNSLYSGDFLYPPSELSQFGIDFAMTATWRVVIPESASGTITIANDLTYWTASHYLSGSKVTVYLQVDGSPLYVSSDGGYSSNTLTLNLPIMALDPVGANAPSAIVGFLPANFIPAVTALDDSGSASLPEGFKIIAATNDLLIEDTTAYGSSNTSGFTASQTKLTAAWSDSNAISYSLTLYFKILDSISEYTLYIKHWRKSSSPQIVLTVSINASLYDYAITNTIDSLEAEGGAENMLKIQLRDLDFSSVNYHDFLKLGLNSITISIAPLNGDYTNAGYEIRAIAIKKE